MWVQAASSMACWYSWSLDRGTGPRGQTPSDGGMLTSDRESCGAAAAGGPEGVTALLGKMSEESRETETRGRGGGQEGGGKGVETKR